MKKLYHVSDDIFIAAAFATFILGGFFKLLDIQVLFWGITAKSLIYLSFFCLLFSIALSLYDLAYKGK
jgi:hypothetical protein